MIGSGRVGIRKRVHSCSCYCGRGKKRHRAASAYAKGNISRCSSRCGNRERLCAVYKGYRSACVWKGVGFACRGGLKLKIAFKSIQFKQEPQFLSRTGIPEHCYIVRNPCWGRIGKVQMEMPRPTCGSYLRPIKSFIRKSFCSRKGGKRSRCGKRYIRCSRCRQGGAERSRCGKGGPVYQCKRSCCACYRQAIYARCCCGPDVGGCQRWACGQNDISRSCAAYPIGGYGSTCRYIRPKEVYSVGGLWSKS